MTPVLATTVCGIALRNPVLAASGTFAYGVEFEKLVDLNALGGLVVKGLSREPIEGNPQPRLYESPSGMINSIGLQNIGVRAFVRDKLPALARLRTAVFESPVRSVDVAPTLARAMGVAPPSSSDGRVLGEAFGE